MRLPTINRGPKDETSLGSVPQSAEVRRLREERLRLAELVAERTWDLGGLTYEMAIRDHFRVDVLTRRAAELQELESELSEVERLLANADGVGGSCRYCGSPHARGAGYCWRCGHPLGTPQAASSHPHVVEAPTIRLEAAGGDRVQRAEASYSGDDGYADEAPYGEEAGYPGRRAAPDRTRRG